MLRDVDHLLLRYAAEDTDAVVGGRETHDGVEWLAIDPAVFARDRKFADREARRRLQHPGEVWVLRLQRRFVKLCLPFRIRK